MYLGINLVDSMPFKRACLICEQDITGSCVCFSFENRGNLFAHTKCAEKFSGNLGGALLANTVLNGGKKADLGVPPFPPDLNLSPDPITKLLREGLSFK